jgi:glycosyltransferase involved in cell wall biosynthesis
MSGVRVVVLTHSPSPYQIELFNAVNAEPDLELTAIYLWESDPARSWAILPRKHNFVSLNGDPSKIAEAKTIVERSDICVFNFYTDPSASRLIEARAQTGQPWVFWGERPGYKNRVLGPLLRRWKLRPLHKSRATIWGIGRCAVEAYKDEFGTGRHYADVPYFSDLRRFALSNGKPNDKCVFLFSGALSKRKGADLLARAFVDLARERTDVELRVVGTGEYLPQLRETLSSYRVQFLGFNDWEELPYAYQSAHFLCAPSRYDGWGMVVPEALAAGLPVISTDRTGAAIEFIETNKNGWLIAANDIVALFSAMREAASLSRQQREELTANARATVENHQLENGVRKVRNEIEYTLQNWST